jgi:hypothetical protein
MSSAFTTQPQIPTWLETPANAIPKPPVETRVQELPFGELQWENFERLCLRLVRLESNVEHCQLYGKRGQQQHGIDLYARRRSPDGYSVYQCKREKKFDAGKIKLAVERFLEGQWFGKANMLILCTTESLVETRRAEEVEAQRVVLNAERVEFVIWDSFQLSSKLKDLPSIVDDFFGRKWVELFCGEDAVREVGARLDGSHVADFRRRLGVFYSRLFNAHDPGLPLLSGISDQNPIPMEERFVLPDVDDRRFISPHSIDDTQSETNVDPTSTISNELRLRYRRRNLAAQRRVVPYEHRQPIDKWLATKSRSILLGGPGSGKSSLLRFLVTDLLKEEPSLHVLAEKWGQYLPVWIPFAYWTKKIASAESGDISLEEAIEKWLTSWGEQRLWPLVQRALEDDRLLLFVDGLDEYSRDSSARLALSRIQVFAEQRNLPVVATSRPHGFDQLNTQTVGWEIGSLSDFSQLQQQQLARIWFRHWTTHTNPALVNDQETLERTVKKQIESLSTDLKSSSDLRELAKIPLLFSLLIGHKLHDVQLPPSRFKAYESLIQHLLVTHPKKRRLAASLNEPAFELSDREMLSVLSHLAFRVHQQFNEGIFDHDQARAIVTDYLKDPDSGFGLDSTKARTTSAEVLQIGEDTLGLIVKKSHTDLGFFHRTFQEYLAAIHLSTIPFEIQLSIVEARCTDLQWREPILALLFLTSRSEDVRKVVDCLQQKSVNTVERLSLDLLLGEIAFGDFNCGTALSKELAHTAFHKIEVGSSLPHREKLLRQTLEGLRSTRVRELVKTKLVSWFPDRTKWNRHQIIREMGNWTLRSEVVECLLTSFYDEDSHTVRAAASALAILARGDEETGNRIADLAWGEVDPLVRAGAIRCLSNGWPRHASTERVLRTARNSSHPVLRLIAIAGKVLRAEQSKSDLKELFFLGSFESGLGYDWRSTLARVLVTGWRGVEEVKHKCLDALEGSNRRDFERDVARLVLVGGFPQDDKVAEYFAKELSREYFHAPTLYPREDEEDFFETLLSNFKDHPVVAPAADAYCQRNLKRDYLTHYSSALVGHSNDTKDLLLSRLQDRPGPIVSVLLKGWGMEDSQVRQQLTALVLGRNEDASIVADLIPAIVPDKNEARARLLELANDSTCTNRATVLSGLTQLGSAAMETGVVDLALEWIEGGAHHSVSDALVRGFSFDPRVRDLAIRSFRQAPGDLATIASVYGGDAEISALLIKAVTPLPSALRLTIATRLNEGLGDDEFVLDLLGAYDSDSDSEVKVEAAVGYYNRIKNTGRETEVAVERLRKEIETDFDMMGTRQAAFCGLVVLERLDVMKEAELRRSDLSERRVRVPISEIGDSPTVPFMKTLLQNWDYIHEVFKEEFWFRFALCSPEVDSRPAWKELCLFADEYPRPRDEAIAFFEARKNDKEILNLNVLSFLDRSVPKSQLLLDCCMSALNIDWGSPHYSSDEAIFAVELLGKHFAGNEDALNRLIQLRRPMGKEVVEPGNGKQPLPENFILALCEGWPQSDEMSDVYDELFESQQPLTWRTHFQLASRGASTNDIFRELRSYLKRAKRSELVRFQTIARFVVRRLKKDEEFGTLLLKHLRSNPTTLEKAAFPRLISLAGGMLEIRQWCVEEIDREFDGTKPHDIGVDVVEGRFRPIVHSLLDAINLGTV